MPPPGSEVQNFGFSQASSQAPGHYKQTSMAQPQSQISNTLIQNMQNFNNVSAMPGMQTLIGPQGLQSLQAHI